MMQRRELFSSLASSFQKKEQGSYCIRPPYYNDENSFANECKRCDAACAKVCDEDIIIIQEDKTPILEFSKSGCTYCDKCAKACQFGVLKTEYKKDINAKIVINMLKCISWDNVMCFSCKELCMENAIEFLGLFRPEIDQDKCNSCGFCIKVCPTNAVEVKKWQ